MNSQKDKMHPQDMRNLIIFFVISIALYFVYDAYILKPQRAAMMAAQRQAAFENQMAAMNPATPAVAEAPALPRDQVLTQSARVIIENDQVSGSLSLRGGRIDDIALRKYFETLEKKDPVILLSPPDTNLPRFVELGWIAESGVKVPDEKTLWQISGGDRLTPQTPVTLFWENGQGLRFERTLSLDEYFMITAKDTVTNNGTAAVTLHPYGLISQKGQPDIISHSWLLLEGPIGYIGDQLIENTYGTMQKKPQQSWTVAQGWAALNEKYWLTSVIPQQGEQLSFRMTYTGVPPKKGDKDLGRYQIDFTGAEKTIAPGQSASTENKIFVGAKQVLLLEDYAKKLGIPHFDLAVNFGWFWFLAKPFFYALHFMGHTIGNFGFAIIMLTILIRSAVFPLTNTSYRSFAKLKKVSPQIAALRAQHGNDKAALQKELVKLYEKEGVNPMAGCIPVLLQIPIFFALYKVLFVTIEMRHAPFIGWIHDLSAKDPTAIYNLFGLLPYAVPETIPIPVIGGILHGIISIGVWPCLMLVMMIIQKNLNPPPQDPVQRDMATYFPFFITYVMSQFAAGLVIYWTFSALITILQQIIIMKSLGVPVHLFGETKEEEKLKEAIDKGPAVHPLAEMAEHRVEEALFGDEPETPPRPISPPRRKPKKKK